MFNQVIAHNTPGLRPYLSAADVSSYASIAYRLQFLTGCRSCEVLGLVWNDVDKAGNVFLNSAKGGCPHVVNIAELIPWVNLNRSEPSERVFPITYRQLYSYYLRLGVAVYVRSRQHTRAVTHAPRHVRARLIRSLSQGNADAVAHGLGHRSKKSQLNYQ